MKKNLILLLVPVFSFLVLSNLNAQNCVWAQAGVGSYNNFATSVATDASGNIYETGYFESSTIAFGTTTLTNTDTIQADIYLVKYNSSGSVLWAKSFGGINTDFASSVTVDISGNIYLFGNFESPTITFGTTTLTNANGYDLFLVKLNNAGTVTWAKDIRVGTRGITNDAATAVTTDKSGNVYITGYFDSSITFGSIYLADPDYEGTDIFLAKYDSLGNAIWAKNSDGVGADGPAGIAVDGSGNVYLTGSWTSTTIGFDAITLTNTYFDNTLFFLVKYNSSGSAVWAKSVGDSNGVAGNSVVADASGNIYVAGGFSSPTATFDAITLTNDSNGTNDIFLVKYNTSGSVIWAKSAGGNSDDVPFSITQDASGNIFVAGVLYSLSAGFGATTLTGFGMFLAKYNASGNVVWAKSAAPLSSVVPESIIMDVFGNLYVTGDFNNLSVSLDGNMLSDPTSPYQDVFLARYNDVATGVPIINKDIHNIILYPNPAKGEIILSVGNQETVSEISIVDITGREVYHLQPSAVQSIPSQSLNIKLPSLCDGTYILHAIGNNTSDCIPFLIKK